MLLRAMRHQTRIIVVSLAAGFAVAGVLQAAALIAAQAGFGRFAEAVDWPAHILLFLMPGNAMAWLASFPLGGAVYSVIAWLILKKKLTE